MTQFYFEALAADNGGAPSNLAYTHRWVTTGLTVSVTTTELVSGSFAAAGVDAALNLASSSSARRTISIDSIEEASIGSPDIVEVFWEGVQEGSTNGEMGAILRGSGASGSETGYRITRARSNGSHVIGEYNSGSAAVLDSETISFGFVRVAVRTRISSGHVIESRTWLPDTESEPGTFSISADDSASPRSAGWVGLFKSSGSSSFPNWQILKIGIGTDGDSAPTEPLSDGTINCTAGAVTYSGVQAALSEVVTATANNITYTGGTAEFAVEVAATPSEVTYSGVQASVEGIDNVECTPSEVTYSGVQASVEVGGDTVTAVPGEISYSGVQASILEDDFVDCASGGVIYSGVQCTISSASAVRGRNRRRHHVYSPPDGYKDVPVKTYTDPILPAVGNVWVPMSELLYQITPILTTQTNERKAQQKAKNMRALQAILKVIH